jgi:hypothetical protein
MLSLRVELKTSRLLNGCSNQLSYESFCLCIQILVLSTIFHSTQSRHLHPTGWAWVGEPPTVMLSSPGSPAVVGSISMLLGGLPSTDGTECRTHTNTIGDGTQFRSKHYNNNQIVYSQVS